MLHIIAPKAGTIVWLLGIFFIIAVARFSIRLYQVRKNTKAVSEKYGLKLLPHSFFWGHLQIVGKVMGMYPSDANPQYLPLFLLKEYPEYCTEGAIYIDTWPISYPMLAVFHPDMMAQFTQKSSLAKHELLYHEFMPLTQCQDLINSEGQQWKTWRSILNPGFSLKNILSLVPLMVEEIQVFRTRLDQLARTGETAALLEMGSKLAFDVVGRVALDIRIDGQNRPNRLYRTLLESISLLIVDAAPRTLWKKTLNIRRPFILWNNNRKIRNYLSPIINSHLQTREHNKGVKTVTGLAIEAYPKLNSVTSKQVDSKFIDILIAQLKIFFIAGTDTTAATISFMYELLHSNPEKLRKLRAEHEEILGDKDTLSTRIIAHPNLLNQLPYTTAVIKETLRLFPPVGSVREGNKDFFLINPETGARLPTDGWMLFSCSMAEQRHEAFFPRPHDFIPERWFAGENEEFYVRKNTFRPFELGPRNCIGQELVQMELRIVLALTIREFDIVPMLAKDGLKLFGQVSYQRPFMDELAASPKEGMPITVKYYEDGHLTQ